MQGREKIILCVVVAMFLPCLAALVYFVLLEDNEWSRIVYGMAKVFILLWPILTTVVFERQRFRVTSIDWLKHFKSLPWGAASGLIIGIAIFGLYDLTGLGDYVHRSREAITEKAGQMGVLNHYVAFSIFLAVVHSFLEEYYWRWYVYGRLRKLVRPGLAYLLAGGAFAAHHYVVLACFFSGWMTVCLGTCVGMGGVLWCWLYQKQESLIGCWISHMLVDGAILYIGFKIIN